MGRKLVKFSGKQCSECCFPDLIGRFNFLATILKTFRHLIKTNMYILFITPQRNRNHQKHRALWSVSWVRWGHDVFGR